MPTIPDPVPAWLKPENNSVFDSWWRDVAQAAGRFIGADDPQSQVVGLMGTEIPSAGAVDAPVQKLADFARRQVNKAIKAYHGSPHDFEKFSLAKIGTGEGAQAYGHGLYFAEREGVAKEYKKALTDWEIHEPTGRVVSSAGSAKTFQGTPADRALAWVQDAASRNDISDPLRFARGNAAKVLRDDPDGADILKQLDAWIESGAKVKPGGHMYEVNINADPAHFLDWDAPLKDQPESLRYVLGHTGRPTEAETEAMFALAKERGVDPASMPEYKALQARLDEAAKLERDYPSGREVYNQFMHDERDVAIRQGRNADTTLPASQSAASQQLREMGVPGIKYLDQGSRARTGGELIDVVKGPEGWQSKIRVTRPGTVGSSLAGESYITTSAPHPTREAAEQWAQKEISGGTRNFVVFDDTLIDIIRKYGLLPPLSLAALGQYGRSQPAPEPAR